MTADTSSTATRPVLKYELQHICSYTATLALPPEVIGAVPSDVRVNVYVTGGHIWGPHLRGRILPVGADWLTLRTDGVGILDVRATLEAEGGALIYLTLNGIIDFGPNGYEMFLRGELPPDGTPIRATPRFFTSHPDYLWLNRLHGLHIGEAFLSRGEVTYDVYAVH
jgi:hypothetical protein